THFWNYFKTFWNFFRLETSFADKKDFLDLTLKIKEMEEQEIAKYGDLSVKDFLDQYTDSQFVHCMMAISSDSYAVVPYNRVAARDFLEIYQRVIKSKGVGYPKYGCGAIPEAFQKIIKKKSGVILKEEPVDRVLIEDGKTIGVRLAKSGKEILSDIVVANVNLKHFVGRLVDKQYFSSDLISKIEKLKHSFTSVVTHVAFKQPVIEEKFVMKSATLTPNEIAERRLDGEFPTEIGCFMPIVSNISPAMAPKGKQLAFAGIGTTHEYYETHEEQFKELILDNLQELAKKKYDIREEIEWMDVITPKDLKNLFGEQGAIVGLAQTIGQVRSNRIESDLPVEGLFHCGDDSGKDLFGVGTELASLSGQNCAEMILRTRK
ncbi:MAG: hypothetical protein GF364_19960, partial [Candidatus Lokiarchaeota archaeon]|nr:hypothetical protein [Candidatus Lokiarchaeota archaeon]